MTEATINVKFQGGVRIDIGVTPQLERLLQKLTDAKDDPKPQEPGPQPETIQLGRAGGIRLPNGKNVPLEEMPDEAFPDRQNQPTTLYKWYVDSLYQNQDAPTDGQPTEDPHEAGEEPKIIMTPTVTKIHTLVEPTSLENNTPTEDGQLPPSDKDFVRAAMNRVRNRIEGENWQTDTTTEGYRRYHRQLTSEFKNLALQLAGCKPTELPTEELRQKFADEIEQYTVDGEGKLVGPKTPF